ncbi:MAG TPA: SpoIIE family protein phosphatase [Bryobacteraceae bacterium]|jgi:sigma-B regulation protein RsbU (phosphoserine phosphatase)
MQPPSVLIVDDSPTNAELVQGILESEGFRVLAAADGPEGFAISCREKPDLILLDVVMPGENGFETCARLKSTAATADIPIIFLSALDDVKSKVLGLKVGGVDYISKPVYGEEVLARVRVHLRIRETNRALIAEHRSRLAALGNAQRGILVRPEDLPEASFAVYYKPLEEAGGDFYDVAAVDAEQFGYFAADVSGHGVSASFLTSAIKALLRQYSGPLYSPEDAMRGIDSVMRQMLGEDQYLTACYARVNQRTRRLSVVSAGHPPLVVVRRSGTVQAVEMDSDPLGVFSSVVLQRKDLPVARGDRFFLYTDGIIESTPGAARRAGLERLMDVCARHRAATLADLPRLIVSDLRPSAADIADDLLLLAVEVRT